MKRNPYKKQTRGVQRTLDDFRLALFSELSEKRFEQISVEKLCLRASYPRATFYNYFDDKYDLLQYGWIWLSQQIHLEDHVHLPQEQTLYIFFDRIYDFIQDHKDTITKVLSHNPETDYMFSSFRTFMYREIRTIFKECPVSKDHPIPDEILTSHFSNILLLMGQWCITHPQLSKEEASKYVRCISQVQ